MADVWSESNPEPELTPGAYPSSEDHLWEELCRVDVLIRAQVVRWRMLIASTKPDKLWGMVHVTEAEVDAFLRAPSSPPHYLPGDLDAALEPYWAKASELAWSIAASKRATSPHVVLRLERLADRFGLSTFERDALLVALMPELDGRYRRLFGYLQDDASRTRPGVELIAEILRPDEAKPVATRAAFRRGAPLRAGELIVVDEEDGPEPLPVRGVRIDDRVASYLLGDDEPDPRVAGYLTRDPAGALEWDDLDEAGHTHGSAGLVDRLRTLAHRWAERHSEDPRAAQVLVFHGAPGSGLRAAARAVATAVGARLWVADAPAALRAPEGFARAAALVHREAALQGAVVAWASAGILLDRDAPPMAWSDLLETAARAGGLTIVESHVARDREGRHDGTPPLRIDFPAPGFDARRRIWLRRLPSSAEFAPPLADGDALASALANAFALGDDQVLAALATARAHAESRDPGHPRLRVDDLYEGCRRQSSALLGPLARRVEPRPDLKFEDLVLAATTARQVDELRRRIGLRSAVYSGLGFERRLGLGRGIVALFTGPSGTGKTMAAELLAHDQKVDLFKVDLSAIASKWVGETEKNLGRLFDEAETSNAVILIDECDALFSKRGEVKEARDRWANLEANYLLQRIEEYSGVVVLTTNFRQNIDEAFLRRIHAIVEFSPPDPDARARIWNGLFPPDLKHPDPATIAALAKRFTLTGGSLRNVVLDAAFRAVAEAAGSPPEITTRHLILAVAREYQKLGRPITRSEFGEEYYGWVEKELF